ncbi:histone-like nucleoid-structuring protein Lsr2 [Curtobacterium flaccumfaciens]|uniref:histone-like nucleoid-structuring protein Lsr2 n=1 Tax=Curtobacterium flaccumfaciens TaxID=2035 RepID=UPI001ADC71D6|nr:Lsr2 family protein [Curtobacterium flaccumfaciens]MBO9049519.1 Lsr2 family protein [Curtobacterium flaccumfaciens pv. flaccumfaciens]
MAQKVITTLVDDLDGSAIEDNAGGTVRFAIDGNNYEIDLSAAHADELRDALSDYVSAARRVGGRSSSSGSGRASTRNNEDLAAIREWAAKNGHAVSARGRIAQNVKDAYYSAR